MGYDIIITKKKYDNDNDNENDDDNNNDNIVDNLYLTYNHGTYFRENNIYPRDFNGLQIKEILPKYVEVFLNLYNDKEVIENIIEKNLNNYDISYKYDIAYLYEKNNKHVLFIIIKLVVKKLMDINPECYWFSD